MTRRTPLLSSSLRGASAPEVGCLAGRRAGTNLRRPRSYPTARKLPRMLDADGPSVPGPPAQADRRAWARRDKTVKNTAHDPAVSRIYIHICFLDTWQCNDLHDACLLQAVARLLVTIYTSASIPVAAITASALQVAETTVIEHC